MSDFMQNFDSRPRFLQLLKNWLCARFRIDPKTFWDFPPETPFFQLHVIKSALAYIPLIFFILVAVITFNSWDQLKVDLSSEGFNHYFFDVLKFPLAFLAFSASIIAIFAVNHRSIQNVKAMGLTRDQNIFANYYKHKEEFEKYMINVEFVGCSSLRKEALSDLHIIYFPGVREGSYDSCSLVKHDYFKCTNLIISYCNELDFSFSTVEGFRGFVFSFYRAIKPIDNRLYYGFVRLRSRDVAEASYSSQYDELVNEFVQGKNNSELGLLLENFLVFLYKVVVDVEFVASCLRFSSVDNEKILKASNNIRLFFFEHLNNQLFIALGRVEDAAGAHERSDS